MQAASLLLAQDISSYAGPLLLGALLRSLEHRSGTGALTQT